MNAPDSVLWIDDPEVQTTPFHRGSSVGLSSFAHSRASSITYNLINFIRFLPIPFSPSLLFPEIISQISWILISGSSFWENQIKTIYFFFPSGKNRKGLCWQLEGYISLVPWFSRVHVMFWADSFLWDRVILRGYSQMAS